MAQFFMRSGRLGRRVLQSAEDVALVGVDVVGSAGPQDEAALGQLVCAIAFDPAWTGAGLRLVVSAIGARGRAAALTVGLAQSFARAGDKVLLIDADLARPRIHLALEVAPEPGLTNLILGQLHADEVLVHVDGMDVLVAGPQPGDPLPLLTTSAARAAIDDAASGYDVVVLLVPALSGPEQARVASSLGQRCLVVVEPGVTRAVDLAEAVAAVRVAGIDWVRAVLLDDES